MDAHASATTRSVHPTLLASIARGFVQGSAKTGEQGRPSPRAHLIVALVTLSRPSPRPRTMIVSPQAYVVADARTNSCGFSGAGIAADARRPPTRAFMLPPSQKKVLGSCDASKTAVTKVSLHCSPAATYAALVQLKRAGDEQMDASAEPWSVSVACTGAARALHHDGAPVRQSWGASFRRREALVTKSAGVDEADTVRVTVPLEVRDGVTVPLATLERERVRLWIEETDAEPVETAVFEGVGVTVALSVVDVVSDGIFDADAGEHVCTKRDVERKAAR